MCEQWTRIYFARHGETPGNASKNFAERASLPFGDSLSKRGKREAYYLRHRLSGIPFAAYYASPLLRAKETAQKVAGKGIPVIEDPAISERKLGDLEGVEYEVAKPIWEDFIENQDGENTYNITTDKELDARFLPFLKTIAQGCLGLADKNVFMASHHLFLKYVLHKAGISYKDMRGKNIPHGGYFVVETDGENIRLVEVDSLRKNKWLRDLV